MRTARTVEFVSIHIPGLGESSEEIWVVFKTDGVLIERHFAPWGMDTTLAVVEWILRGNICIEVKE